MKTETLFGGRDVPVKLLDGTDAIFRVHQLTLSQYEKAFALLDDEIGLTAFICGHDKLWAENLSPESYESLYAAAQEVNRGGFFAWSARRKAREQTQQEAALAAMATLPPDVVKLAMQQGASTSSTGSPTSPRGRR